MAVGKRGPISLWASSGTLALDGTSSLAGSRVYVIAPPSVCVARKNRTEQDRTGWADLAIKRREVAQDGRARNCTYQTQRHTCARIALQGCLSSPALYFQARASTAPLPAGALP